MILFAGNLDTWQQGYVYLLLVLAGLPVLLICPWLLPHGTFSLVHRSCARSGAHLWRAWRYVGWAMTGIGLQIWAMQRGPTPLPHSYLKLKSPIHTTTSPSLSPAIANGDGGGGAHAAVGATVQWVKVDCRQPSAQNNPHRFR